MWTFIRRLLAEPEAHRHPPVLLDLGAARRVLVIAPHPDDECIGCGGTLARLAHSCEIQVVLVTNGDGAGGLPAGASDTRKAELAQALQVLGIAKPALHLDEPDGHFRDSPGFRQRLQDILAQFQPNWVFLPWLEESHEDHWRIAQACCEVLSRSQVETVLHYEVWTPLPATHLVDIGMTVDRKREALSQHRTALACGNYIESSLGLNAYRAIHLGPEGRAAEAFVVRKARDCSS